jgi:hypothetical protein
MSDSGKVDGRSSRTDYRNSGIRQRERTACRNGHPYDERNTYWKQKKDGTPYRECRECQKLRMQRKRASPSYKQREVEWTRRWRAKNPELNRQLYNENRRRKKEWLDKLKIACVRCGENHPACLEFHHRDRTKKDFTLSTAYCSYSLERIQREAEKCDVLCANCHRKLHHAAGLAQETAAKNSHAAVLRRKAKKE